MHRRCAHTKAQIHVKALEPRHETLTRNKFLTRNFEHHTPLFFLRVLHDRRLVRAQRQLKSARLRPREKGRDIFYRLFDVCNSHDIDFCRPLQSVVSALDKSTEFFHTISNTNSTHVVHTIVYAFHCLTIITRMARYNIATLTCYINT